MKHGFQKKLFRTIAVVFTCFWGVFSLFFLAYAYHSLYQESVTNLSNIAGRTAREIEGLVDSMDSVAIGVSADRDVIAAFDAAASSRLGNTALSNELMPRLVSALIPNTASQFRISLYNARGNFLSTGLSYSQSAVESRLRSDTYEDWYYARPILQHSGSLVDVEDDLWGSSAEKTVTLFRNIYHSTYINYVTGITEVQCPVKYFADLMQDDAHLYTYTLRDENGALLCAAGNGYEETASAAVNASGAGNGIGTAQAVAGSAPAKPASAVISASVTLSPGWTLTLSRPLSSLLRLLLPMTFYFIAFYIAALALFLLLLHLSTRRITQPLSDLTGRVRRITLDQPALNLSFPEYPDEFDELADAFTRMMERLHGAMEENIKRRTYEMQANMIALQSQMNPHFLYNILTVIKSQAREGHTQQVASTCNYLAAMLRYISGYAEDAVPFDDELRHAETYLRLMKTRYEDLFEYTIEITSGFDGGSFLLPKLTLQPLLENCFQHGFKQVLPVWRITVRAYREGTAHVVLVEDNGSGFAAQDVEALKKRAQEFLSNPSVSIPSLTIGGMGLVNTIVRMTLLFHERFRYRIEAAPERGTVVRLYVEDEQKVNEEHSV